MLIEPRFVFTPASFPEYTYVERELRDRAGNLINPQDWLATALATPNRPISLAGPSKSGKTVLVEKVVGKDRLIKVSGAQLKAANDLWEKILDELGAPNQTAASTSDTTKYGERVGVELEANAPLIAKARASIASERQTDTQSGMSTTFARAGYVEVARRLASSNKVVLLDDFHYLSDELQKDIAAQLKQAVEQYDIKFCVAQVLHKGDAVLRQNTDLTGRLVSIDITYWQRAELREIATAGFEKLNAKLNDAAVDAFVDESAGSPQLMQEMCLATCSFLRIENRLASEAIFTLSLVEIERVIASCMQAIDRSRILEKLELGPPTRGTKRVLISLRNADEVDIYKCILSALAMNPPRLSLSKQDITSRIASIVKLSGPSTSNVVQSIKHMVKIAKESMPTNEVLDWDDDRGLQILDPYFLFFLRWIEIYRVRRSQLSQK